MVDIYFTVSVYAYMCRLEFPKRKCRKIVVLYWDKVKEFNTYYVYLKHEAKKLIELHYYNLMKT
jgi:hypothetical protein